MRTGETCLVPPSRPLGSTRGLPKVAYTVTNFKTKKALKEAVQAGKAVEVYQPGPFGPAGQRW